MVTWNPSDKDSNVTLSNGNLTATGSATSGNVRGNFGRTTGSSTKFYYELTLTSVAGGGSCYAGFGLSTASLTTSVGGAGSAADRVVNGNTTVGSTASNNVGAAAAGNVLGLGLDLSTRLMTVYKNGVPAASQIAIALGAGTYYPMITVGSGDVVIANFGASSFIALPSGFEAWDFNPRIPTLPIRQAANQRPIRFIGL